MLLENKNAVIYGGGGAIGGAVARAFAREGARLFLAGRTLQSLEEVAAEIRSAGGMAEAAVLDALDEGAVDEHADAVAASAGSIDVSFNLITRRDVQGIPLIDMATDDLLRAVDHGLRSNFITARAAARHMVEQRSGVILALDSGSATLSPTMDSTGPADAATDTFSPATWQPRLDRRACASWAYGRLGFPRRSRRRSSPRSTASSGTKRHFRA
jgi:NAD(P)-dependent dehydrogenase (short-subunit alcohol dehydrogenase family)